MRLGDKEGLCTRGTLAEELLFIHERLTKEGGVRANHGYICK